MSTKLIIIRHGQSIGNLNERFLGHTDLDLSEKGYKQAEMTAEFLSNVHIDKIYSSDLIRAYNTVFPVAQSRDLYIIKNKNLREIYAGEWENMTYDYLTKHFPKEYTIWKTDIGNARCNGGESVIELQKRIYTEFEKIAKDNDGNTICIGTHATPIRTFYAACKSINKDDMHKIPWASNASVTTAYYKNGKFEIEEYGYDKHLGELSSKFNSNI